MKEEISFNQAIQLLSYLDPKEHIPLFIGAPGIGKSTITKEFCKLKGIPLERQSFLSVALNEVGDLVGYPYEIKTEDGKQTGRMGFAVPSWWLGQRLPDGSYRPLDALLAPFDDGLEYCLDVSEANRGASREKQAAMLGLFLERHIQGRYLPEKTYIILSVNEGIEYNVEDFDPAVRNRIMPIYIKPTIEEWLSWFKEYEHRTQIIEKFLIANKNEVFLPKSSELKDGKQFSSPRSLAKLSSFVKNYINVNKIKYETKAQDLKTEEELFAFILKKEGKDRIVFFNGVNAIVGKHTGDRFLSFVESYLNNKDLYDLDDSRSIDSVSFIKYKNMNIQEFNKYCSSLNNFQTISFLESASRYFESNNIWDDKNKELLKNIISFTKIPGENKIQFLNDIKQLSDAPINLIDSLEKKCQ